MKRKSRTIKSNLDKVDAAPGKPDADILEITVEMLARAVFPPGGIDLPALRRRVPPSGTGKKQSTTIRFDKDVVARFRATGPSWQTRVNDALREWLDANATPKPRRRATKAG